MMPRAKRADLGKHTRVWQGSEMEHTVPLSQGPHLQSPGPSLTAQRAEHAEPSKGHPSDMR